MWDCLNQDDDDLLGLLGNQTPLRDCRGFFDIDDFTCKETLDLEESRESKRRRILEYPSESNQSEDGNREISSTLGTSEVSEISLLCTDEPQSFNWDSQNNSNNFGILARRVLHIPMIKVVFQETYQLFLSMTGTTENDSVTESLVMQETRKLSTLKVSKGASLVKAKQNLTTTIAYPFTLIKPSWEEGDVITLKDINQRIRAPPKKAPETLGTSAFSGKPVVGKTRIRTDGGRGSITILRTKG
uniref:Protein XRI1 n=1 Tax=Oryza barthii TaxID=65489 RepID=A0A0D3H6N8_9ORYZ